MVSEYQQLFESILFESFGYDVEVLDFSLAAAGTVNTGARVVSSEGVFFCKLNELPDSDFFEPEAKDLALISECLRVPSVRSAGKSQGHNFLLMEFLPEAPASKSSMENAGRQLARLHQIRSQAHGHPYANRLASLEQDNQWKTDGINFLIQNRILPLIGYCLMEEKISLDLYKRIEALCARLGKIIPEEQASLLHGDLWSGNLLSAPGPEPVFIDPAAYYGFRESELAFTYLFGGFEPAFYEAYLEIFPLEPGFGERISIYHLHPLLVHVYLFGSGYIAGLERILKRFS